MASRADRERGPSYPFAEAPRRLTGGLAVSGTSFNDVTANGSATLSLFKPWTNQDLGFDIIASLNYDSGRDVNRLKPNVSSTAVYRYHLNDTWNLFAGNFTAVNSGVITGSTDDEDTTVVNSTFLGPGINLWRGETIENFLDLQLGFGARYEYDEINEDVVRDRLSPVIGLILYGRGFSIGEATFSPLLAVGTGSEQFDEYFAYVDLNLKIPIRKNWAWNSRILARYASESPDNRSNSLNYQYLTGLTYTFSP